MLISAPDALDPDRSWLASLRYVPYFLAGIALLRMPCSERASQRLLMGVFAVLVFWTADGLIQWQTGFNLLGYPRFDGIRLTGMFGAWPHLGLVLSVLSPVYFEALRQLVRRWEAAWLLVLPYIAVILLGGSRAPWLLLLAGALMYGWHYHRSERRAIVWTRWIGRMAVVLLASLFLLGQVDWLSERVAQMANLASGDYSKINTATSLRLPLWEAAWALSVEHWINGVGVRNFATEFMQCCAQPGLPYGNTTLGHPHLLIGEISAETGLVGLLGYLVFLAMLLRAFVASPPSSSHPWIIAAILVAFPLNSTIAFYSLFSSSILWLLVLAWLGQQRCARILQS